jgi:hypothetical protein
MPNGTGLLGGFSSTQSAIIVPLPNSSTIYYVFTCDQELSTNGINYSIVDMTLNGGFGAVTSKNLPLAPWIMSEKICAVKHCNNRDVWVIVKGWLVNTFTAWLVTPSGITVSVASNVGYTPIVIGGAGGAKQGVLKANAQGNRLAAAYYGAGRIEVYPFNNSTGMVSAPTNVDLFPGFYGLEFSPNGRFLYASTNPGNLYQYDLCNSFQRYTVATAGAFMGSLQNAIDGKMYIARGVGNTFFAAVNNPNVQGAACGFVLNSVSNGASNTNFGLPNFISSYFKPPPPQFTYSTNGCLGVILGAPTIQTTCYNPQTFTISWQSPLGNSITTSPIFSSSGPHQVSMIVNYGCSADTVTQTVFTGLAPLPSAIGGP